MASFDLKNSLAIRSTRFFMKFTGFWIWNDRRNKIIMDFAMTYSLIAILFAWCVTASDLWYSRSDFQEAAYGACNTMTILIIGLKLTMFSIRRDAFMNLIKFCHENFWERDYDTFGESVLQGCDKRCVYFVLTFTFFAQSTVCTYMLRTIVENLGKNETERILPFTIRVNLPLTTTPYYETAFLFETLSLIHSGICYLCFDNFLCIMNVHTAGQFRILQRRFERLCYGPDSKERKDSFSEISIRAEYEESKEVKALANPYDQYQELKSCVRDHQSLIRFTKMVEEVYTFVILGQVVLFSLLICLVSYQAVLADGVFTTRLIFIVHSAGTFTQLFMFTLTCDDLIRESEGVAEAAYRTRWYCSLSNRVCRNLGKDLMVVIMRSRRPCCLTAGGFFPVSLETFTTILSTAMSYLTLLRQGQDSAELST